MEDKKFFEQMIYGEATGVNNGVPSAHSKDSFSEEDAIIDKISNDAVIDEFIDRKMNEAKRNSGIVLAMKKAQDMFYKSIKDPKEQEKIAKKYGVKISVINSLVDEAADYMLESMDSDQSINDVMEDISMIITYRAFAGYNK